VSDDYKFTINKLPLLTGRLRMNAKILHVAHGLSIYRILMLISLCRLTTYLMVLLKHINVYLKLWMVIIKLSSSYILVGVQFYKIAIRMVL